MRPDVDFERLITVDILIAKATATSGDALFLQMENRLASSLTTAWSSRAATAVSRGVSAFRGGAGKAAILRAVAAPFGSMGTAAAAPVKTVARNAYLEGKREMLARAQDRYKPTRKGSKRPKVPEGFDPDAVVDGSTVFNPGAKPVEGVPKFRSLSRETYRDRIYVVKPSDLAKLKLYGIDTGGDSAADSRTSGILNVWNKGGELAGVEIDVNAAGDYFVADGNHRLWAAALDSDRPIAVRFRPVEADDLNRMDKIGARLAEVSEAGSPIVSLESALTLRDERAIASMARAQLNWIDDFYASGMSESVDDIVSKAMLETGLGRAEAGKLLEQKLAERLTASGIEIPAGLANKSASYFEMLAANVTSSARVRGQMSQMLQIGVTSYVIVAAGDERTCKRCRFMDGKTFQVKHAQKMLSSLEEADTPDKVRSIHPWASKVSDIENAPGKYILPPFHGACRCVVDISEDAELTFEPADGWG